MNTTASHLSTLPLTVALTVDGAIDIAAALTSDDATLTAAIELAGQRMRASKRDRTSLPFQDAKTADTVLRAERTSRQSAALRVSSPVPAPRLHPCGKGCTDSAHPVSECGCACLGANHRAERRVLVPSGRTGFERLPVIDDEVW